MKTPLKFVHVEGSTSKALVLFHGYGANMHDLAPLHRWLDPEQRWHWYFPQGPLSIPFGAAWEGHAWFPIDMEALEASMREGRHRDFSGPATPAFHEAIVAMESFVAEVAKKHGAPVVGGFSQGAMGASHVVMTGKVPAKALVLLSGALVDAQALRESAVTALPFFQSHGQSDPLLGLDSARALYDLLERKGLSGEWHDFRGGHEIPPQVLDQLRQFLNQAMG